MDWAKYRALERAALKDPCGSSGLLYWALVDEGMQRADAATAVRRLYQEAEPANLLWQWYWLGAAMALDGRYGPSRPVPGRAETDRVEGCDLHEEGPTK